MTLGVYLHRSEPHCPYPSGKFGTYRGVVARTEQDGASTQDTYLAVDDSYYCIPTGHSEREEAMSLKLSFTHLFT